MASRETRYGLEPWNFRIDSCITVVTGSSYLITVGNAQATGAITLLMDLLDDVVSIGAIRGEADVKKVVNSQQPKPATRRLTVGLP